MTRLHVAAIAFSLVGCAPTPVDRQNAGSPSDTALDNPACGATMPAKTLWLGGNPIAPLPPPQTDTGVVLVADSFDDPATMWAFAVDAGKITAWLVFPRYRLGELVMQVHNPPTQLSAKGSNSFVPKLELIKPMTPIDPHLPPDAQLVTDIGWLETQVNDQAVADIALCKPGKAR